MNGLDGITGWKTIKQRLSFKGLGCCGRTIVAEHCYQEEEDEEELIIQAQVSNVGPSSSMNLAMALAAERNLRDVNVGPTRKAVGNFKTLIRLIEETDGVDLMKSNNKEEEERVIGVGVGVGGSENDWVCCVCMERNKGAAFIPCGHTYCRVCSRELWLNRGSCPICSRSILEILDTPSGTFKLTPEGKKPKGQFN